MDPDRKSQILAAENAARLSRALAADGVYLVGQLGPYGIGPDGLRAARAESRDPSSGRGEITLERASDQGDEGPPPSVPLRSVTGADDGA